MLALTLHCTPKSLITICCRSLSTQTAKSISPNHSIYISKSTNPYFNITFEDWLFRHKAPNEPLLLIYRDEPCVVIGRNQNPWNEVNMSALRRTRTPFVRRRSGGGAVYHDLGNTNFSIHLPRSSFERRATAQVILRAVRSLGIDAHVNDRNDICVGKDKVSGSAYKIVNNRAYHHGTMLISTRLGDLGDLLRPDHIGNMITKGVASVRSPVRNLQQFRPTVSHDGFAHAVVAEFRNEYDINEPVNIVEENDDTTSVEYIHQGMRELPSWEWGYGQTPEFTYTVSNSFVWGDVTAEIRSKHGVILSCSLFQHDQESSFVNLDFNELATILEGKRYGFVDDAIHGKAKSAIITQSWRDDVWYWLMRVMDT